MSDTLDDNLFNKGLLLKIEFSFHNDIVFMSSLHIESIFVYTIY